ncbi:MAG: hypothetical protein EXQ88_01685 [Alphaproteobacteria bacterium]|nr:hypothetical protein [Alphaproteobacteria bacterium]
MPELRHNAERYIARRFPVDYTPRFRPRAVNSTDRLRVWFLSADFRVNALWHLAGEIFSALDRDRLETFAYSIGPNCPASATERQIECFC